MHYVLATMAVAIKCKTPEEAQRLAGELEGVEEVGDMTYPRPLDRCHWLVFDAVSEGGTAMAWRVPSAWREQDPAEA